ncbi:TonB-system energizer ExbB, partial [Campylobacter jejuni]|nr:TonB-system energizer ExbB [Campylobacter jejuni]
MILIINLFFIQYNLLKFISIFLEKNMEFLKDYIDLIIFLILGIMA